MTVEDTPPPPHTRRPRRLVVDAMNVIGTTPDGWWRDRDGAARRLLDRLAAFATREALPVTVVLDGRPLPDVAEGTHTRSGHGPVEVLYARRPGRDAADDRIADLVAADDAPTTLLVVTSDRGLATRVRTTGAPTIGARAFLEWMRETEA